MRDATLTQAERRSCASAKEDWPSLRTCRSLAPTSGPTGSNAHWRCQSTGSLRGTGRAALASSVDDAVKAAARLDRQSEPWLTHDERSWLASWLADGMT